MLNVCFMNNTFVIDIERKKIIKLSEHVQNLLEKPEKYRPLHLLTWYNHFNKK